MYVKWVYLCVIILESLYVTSAVHCDADRVKRSSEDATDTLKFYIECPAAVEEPMVAMASENQQVEEESPLAKFLRVAKINPPPIKKPLFSKKPVNLENFRSADLSQIQPLHNLLDNGLTNNVFSPLNNLPNNPLDLTRNAKQFQNGLLNPLPEIPKPSIENFQKLRNPLTNDFFNLPQHQNIFNNPLDLTRSSNQFNSNFLKPLSEESEIALENMKTQQNNLVNRFPELSERQNTLDKSTQLQSEIKNILDKSQPQGRFTNVLKDFIIARKKEDLKPSSSHMVTNEEEIPQNDEVFQEPTLAEKMNTVAEQKRQQLANVIASAKDRLSELRSNTMTDSNPENSNDFVARSLPSIEEIRQNNEMLQEPTLAEKIKISAEQKRQQLADMIASAKNRLSERRSNTMTDSNPENSNDFVARSLPSIEGMGQNNEMLQEPTLAEKIKILAEQKRQQFADTVASAKNRLSELRSNTMTDSNPENSNDFVARSLPSIEGMGQNNEMLQEPTLAEKIKILAEQRRKAFDDAIASARNKFLETRSNTMKDSEPENSNDFVARSLPNKNGNNYERSKLLRDKIIERFRQNNEIKPPELPSFDKTNARQSNLNSILSEPEKNINKFQILAEKTKEIARKLNKFINFDNEEEIKAIKSIANPFNQRSNIPSQPQELFSMNAVQEPTQVLLTDKLKNLMSQNPRISPTPLSKRQKIDDNMRTSNSESNLISDKISNPKVAMAERVQVIADKIRNALKPPGTSELRSSNNKDSDVDNSNIDEVVEEAPEKDMEAENSDTIVKETPKDGVIDLSADSSKSANICKCIRVAFPEKFENGHFVMKSRNNDDLVSSASENESKSIIPVIPKIPASSTFGSKLKRVFNSRNRDQSTMADETRPIVAAPPESFRTELSDVDRAMMADQGIRSLLEFIKIVDQVDQYISTKARKAIARLASVLTEDEDARIL